MAGAKGKRPVEKRSKPVKAVHGQNRGQDVAAGLNGRKRMEYPLGGEFNPQESWRDLPFDAYNPRVDHLQEMLVNNARLNQEILMNEVRFKQSQFQQWSSQREANHMESVRQRQRALDDFLDLQRALALRQSAPSPMEVHHLQQQVQRERTIRFLEQQRADLGAARSSLQSRLMLERTASWADRNFDDQLLPESPPLPLPPLQTSHRAFPPVISPDVWARKQRELRAAELEQNLPADDVPMRSLAAGGLDEWALPVNYGFPSSPDGNMPGGGKGQHVDLSPRGPLDLNAAAYDYHDQNSLHSYDSAGDSDGAVAADSAGLASHRSSSFPPKHGGGGEFLFGGGGENMWGRAAAEDREWGVSGEERVRLAREARFISQDELDACLCSVQNLCVQ